MTKDMFKILVIGINDRPHEMNLPFLAAMKKMDVEVDLAGVGDRLVLELMKKTGAVLGGEDSGHMIFLDCHTTGDGIVSALKLVNILRQSGQKTSDLAAIMTTFPQKLINVNVKEKPPIEDVESIRDAIAAAEAKLGESGRVLIRYSGTQPMCRVMVEGPTEKETEAIAQHLAEVVKESIG